MLLLRCQCCHGVVAFLGMIWEYFNNMFTKCLFCTKKALVISLYRLEQNVLNTISSKMISMIPPESNEHFEMMAPWGKMKMTTPKHLPTIDFAGGELMLHVILVVTVIREGGPLPMYEEPFFLHISMSTYMFSFTCPSTDGCLFVGIIASLNFEGDTH